MLVPIMYRGNLWQICGNFEAIKYEGVEYKFICIIIRVTKQGEAITQKEKDYETNSIQVHRH